MKRKVSSFILGTIVCLSFSLVSVSANDNLLKPTYETEVTTTWVEPQVSDSATPILTRDGVAFCKVVGINSGSYLNVRSGPGTNYSVVGALKNNASITHYLLRGTENWCKITASGGISGYIASQYVGSCSVS